MEEDHCEASNYKKGVAYMKRIVVFVLVAATLATLIAGPVLAQAENSAVHFGPEPLANEGLLNPCTGAVVPLTGEIQGFL